LSKLSDSGCSQENKQKFTEKCFSLQISVVLRYVDFSPGEACIREDFVSFLDAFGQLSKSTLAEGTESEESEDEDGSMAYRTAGKTDRTDEELSLTRSAIGGFVLGDMKKMNLRMEKCASIGTDGCAVMLSDIGAVNEIRKEAKNAVMTPCFSHKLNNSISKSVKVRLIENVASAIREVDKFFKNSFPKRVTVLSKILGEKIVQLCETRLVERHDAVLQFVAKLPLIIEALSKISEWKNRETAGKSNNSPIGFVQVRIYRRALLSQRHSVAHPFAQRSSSEGSN